MLKPLRDPPETGDVSDTTRPGGGLPEPVYADFNAFLADGGRDWREEGTLLILSRHGESLFNRVNTINGPENSPLLDTGEAQAAELGKTLARFPIDEIMSSPLQRATRTVEVLLPLLSGTPGVSLHEAMAEMERGVLAGRPKKMTGAEIEAFLKGFDDPAVRAAFAAKFGLTEAQTALVVDECRKAQALLRAEAAKAGLSEDEYARRVAACENTLDCRPPLGESFVDQQVETRRFVADVIDPLSGGSHLLMGHGMSQRLLMLELLGIPMTSLDQLYSIDQGYCGITVLWRRKGDDKWTLLVFNSDRFGKG